MTKFNLPDFSHSILNLSSTLAEFLGAENSHPTLPSLKSYLSKPHKNIVFICFDGLGINPLNQNVDAQNFFRRHIVETLVSTFPSTTTAATTSLATNRFPLEHGYFGWSLYYEKLNRNIDIFLNQDSQTGEPIEIGDSSPLTNFDYYFDTVDECEYQINTIFPPYVRITHPERNTTFRTMDEFFNYIREKCQKDGKQFVYSYYPDPDYTMHGEGVTSAKTKEVIEKLSNHIEQISTEIDDTLFIITADHGQIDVEGYVPLYKDQKLYDMLVIYPYMEARAVAFKVKPEYLEEFPVYFTQKYGEDFELHESKELLEKGYFGDCGDKAFLLGDFIAIGTYTHKIARFSERQHLFKGHHTSLTEEMLVPLIIVDTHK